MIEKTANLAATQEALRGAYKEQHEGVLPMIKRSLATLAVTGLALATPAAAFAINTDYPAPAPALSCSTAQAAPGSTFTCTATGQLNADAILTTDFPGATAEIAGTDTKTQALSTPTSNVNEGTTTFSITAPSIEGDITITLSVNQQSPDGVAVEVSSELSGTGFDSMPLAVGAGVLLVAGAAVVFVAARRRSAQNA